MIYIRNLPECKLLIETPELYREVISYLLYCRQELIEYEDKEDVDDHDFNFQILGGEDLPILNDFGPPEETVQISIKADGMVQTMYRIVYPTAVLFIPADISENFSF